LPQRDEFVRNAADEFRRGHAGLLRAELHLLPVLIEAGEEVNFAPGEPHIAGHGVGQHLFIGVADVRRAVGVVDGGGDEKSAGHGRAYPRMASARQEE
jgi:hypothetical protein